MDSFLNSFARSPAPPLRLGSVSSQSHLLATNASTFQVNHKSVTIVDPEKGRARNLGQPPACRGLAHSRKPKFLDNKLLQSPLPVNKKLLIRRDGLDRRKKFVVKNVPTDHCIAIGIGPPRKHILHRIILN